MEIKSEPVPQEMVDEIVRMYEEKCGWELVVEACAVTGGWDLQLANLRNAGALGTSELGEYEIYD